MEEKLEKARANADLLNEKVGQQAGEAPVDADSGNGPRRRTWEGYAADYHALSERLVEVSQAQRDAMAQVRSLEEQLAAKNGDLARVKAQRLKDLDRLAAVSRTRDLLEKRASAQMARVAAALARTGAAPAELAKGADEGAQGAASHSMPATMHEQSLASLLPDAADRQLGWGERRWWNETIRVAQRSHRAGRLDDARATFEVALRTRQTASLWEQYGHVLRENSQFSEAEHAYRRALEMRPGKAELMFLTGYCLEMDGRPGDAVAHYEDALASDPGLVERYDHLRDFRARLEK